jgi:hypothetical protein
MLDGLVSSHPKRRFYEFGTWTVISSWTISAARAPENADEPENTGPLRKSKLAPSRLVECHFVNLTFCQLPSHGLNKS